MSNTSLKGPMACEKLQNTRTDITQIDNDISSLTNNAVHKKISIKVNISKKKEGKRVNSYLIVSKSDI